MTIGESTSVLLARAKDGDAEALDVLFSRHVPRLRQWASGRLPRWARDISDTPDLVQETVLHTLRKMDGFEPAHEGALQAYLRQAVMNRIRDEIRRRQRRPVGTPPSDIEALAPSPLEQVIGQQTVDRYEAALARLRDEDREVLIGRIELGLTYEELAEAVGKPSADAARKAAQRALVRLVEDMQSERER